MKSKLFLFLSLGACFFLTSCKKYPSDNLVDAHKQLITFNSKIEIDSTFAYIGDPLYNKLIEEYNSKTQTNTRSLSPEDDAFFNKKINVKTTENVLLYGRNYIYPGSILEGNSISNQRYKPIFVTNRNPITVSMTLTHTKPKKTSRTISNPTLSKFNDYVNEMVTDGSFKQSEKFMFQQKRFTFYDEIKSAFGTNIDTRGLFSSRKENSTEKREKILKTTGMYVKFFQSSFTVNMDIEPLSSQPIKGSTNFEPVYVSSVTYGRLGILVFETDFSYNFAEKCIRKEFERIFQNKTTTLTDEERSFFDTTDFKILIIGGDSDYSVQTIKGYSHFLNLIHNSTFSSTGYGVPIACSFTYANTHKIVETEFTNTIHIEPLFVKERQERGYSTQGEYDSYSYSHHVYLDFYRDREGKRVAIPHTDIIFYYNVSESRCKYTPDYNRWPMIRKTCDETYERFSKRNIDFKSSIYIGNIFGFYESDGPMPGTGNQKKGYIYTWEANEFRRSISIEKNSPFYRFI